MTGNYHPSDQVRQSWFLTGPTASGKTSVAMRLAAALDAEIVSLDSMAVYRGMNIGTAKPSPAERRAVPHHLLDIVDPDQDYSLSQYVEAAEQVVAEVRNRGRRVLFVGGTPLYLKALLRGMFHGPPADWEFRQQVEQEVEAVGVEALHDRLWQVDPLAAAKLHPRDKRRIIRALEVYKLTGQPLSHQQIHFDQPQPAGRLRVFELHWARPMLHERIERRVERMFGEGLVDEVRGLLEQWTELGRTAAQAVGYREVLGHLAGQHDLPPTVEMVKARTRQFARRQETWFRSLEECRRVTVDHGLSPEATAGRIVALGRYE